MFPPQPWKTQNSKTDGNLKNYHTNYHKNHTNSEKNVTYPSRKANIVDKGKNVRWTKVAKWQESLWKWTMDKNSQWRKTNIYHNYHSWGWGHLCYLYHGENLWHLSFASTGIEQARGCQEDAIHTAKRGHGHKDRDQKCKRTIQPLSKCLHLNLNVARKFFSL